MTPQIDLSAIKGNNFNFLLSYYDENDAAISATFERIEFKVFRSLPISDNLLMYAGLTGVTYYVSGLSGLSFDVSKRFIAPNKNENEVTSTGSIFFKFQSDVMGQLPAGRHFYNIEVFNGTTFSDMLSKGRFELQNEDGGLL
jgi:hypothetical protein